MSIALWQRSRTRSTSPPNKNRPLVAGCPLLVRTNIVLSLHVAPPLTPKIIGTTDLHIGLSSNLYPCHLQRQRIPERTLAHYCMSRAIWFLLCGSVTYLLRCASWRSSALNRLVYQRCSQPSRSGITYGDRIVVDTLVSATHSIWRNCTLAYPLPQEWRMCTFQQLEH